MKFKYHSGFMQRLTPSLCLLTTFIYSALPSWADSNSQEAYYRRTPYRYQSKQKPLIKFTSPEPGRLVNGTVIVKLHLDGNADPTTVKITSNGQDVTGAFSGCGATPCDITGSLTDGSGLNFGWNLVLARVTTTSGGASSARLRLFEKGGLTDPTNGTSAPYQVHVAMSATAGIEVDYSPENGNGPTYYPGDHDSCSGGQFTLIDLDRTTLAYKATGCYGVSDNNRLQSDLDNFTRNDLLLGSSDPSEPLGPLNFSRVGGTDFTAPNVPQAFSYSLITYGNANPGLANESYNTDSSSPWRGLDGKLVNVSSTNTSLFGYLNTSSVGFAVIPKGNSATVTIGNVKNLPVGVGTVPNPTIPAGFSSVSYTSPALTSTGGGIWVLVLDRYTLAEISSNTYSSRTTTGVVDRQQTTDLANTLSALDNSKLVFLTTLIGSDTSAAPGATPLNTFLPATGWYQSITNLIGLMGVSPYEFDQQMGFQASVGINGDGLFAMVGVPNQFTTAVPDGATAENSPCAAIPNNSTRTCGANTYQWFSSSLDQGETGALKGSLNRDRSFRYLPGNVSPFDPSTLGANPSADQLLADNISSAISSAPPVAWPLNDTTGHKKAYAYISNLLVTRDIYGDGSCMAPPSVCQDVRYYYTSDNANQIANGLDPNAITYPGDPVAAANGFTHSDWNDAIPQLADEKAYLGDVHEYQNWLHGIYDGSAGANLGIQLTTAATKVAGDLNTALGQPDAESAPLSPLNITADCVSFISGVASAIGAGFPPAGVVGGIAGSIASILDLAHDAQRTGPPQPDPYVNQLSDLYSTTSGIATDAAKKFTADMELSNSTFFTGVYSDWFKLQFVALISVNPDSDWYVKDASDGVTETNLPDILLASARRSFYLQTLGQFFVAKNVNQVAKDGYVPEHIATINDLNGDVAKSVGLTLSNLGDYSWYIRNSLGINNIWGPADNWWSLNDGVWDYNFTVLKKNQSSSLPSSMGNALMGTPDGTGSGNLNMNRNLFYDSGAIPASSTVYPDPPLTHALRLPGHSKP